ADISAHRAVDLFFRRILVAGEQRGGLHDLTALTVAALRDIGGPPCLLHWMISVRVEPFDRCDRAAGDIIQGGDAGAGGFTVDMDGASAAQRHSAAVFRSCKTQFVPQIPEQRHRWIAIESLLLAVDAQLDHGMPPGWSMALILFLEPQARQYR